MNASDLESAGSLRALCAKIVSETAPAVFVPLRAGKLRRALSKSFSDTKKLYLRARCFSEKSAALSEAFLWLTDNYPFIEEAFLSCRRALRDVKSVGGKHGAPFLYEAAYALCRVCEGALSAPKIDALVQSCDAALPDGMDHGDIDAFPVLCEAAVLNYIGTLAARFSGDQGIFEGEDSGESLIRAIKAVKYQTIHNYRQSFSACRLEKLLLADPAGVYPHMTESAKEDLRRRLHLEAHRQKISDCAYARRLSDLAEKGKTKKTRYIGAAAGCLPASRKLYFPVLYGAAALLCLLTAAATDLRLLPLFFFPIFDAVKQLTDAVYARLPSSRSDPLPELDLSEIPDHTKTLCVITALLRGEAHDAELFERLERIYNANSGKNIKFGLLCDLGDSDCATKSGDEAAISYARGRIDSLRAKYGADFLLFVRPRSYSKSERAFMAYERKRGAVIELTRLIKEGTSRFDMSIPGLAEQLPFLRQVKYVITLDADTNLGIDVARTLVGKMLHPKNMPVVDPRTKKVISGYGILQPKMSPDLESARATPFSRLLCGSGGTDLYSGASFDLYQSLFGEGIFCGKGIFDVDAFYQTVTCAGFFPEDHILSHDILEGERLRAALLCDVELTDGFPKNELSYLKRAHRWIRGDMQNLIYLSKSISVGEQKRRNDLGALSKYKLYDNVRRAITPIFSLILVILSAFGGKDSAALLVLTAFLPQMIPFLIDTTMLFSSLAVGRAARNFFSKGVTVGIWQSFLRMLFFASMLAKHAFLSLSACLTSLYRMTVSHRHLLEWVTAAQSDSGKPTAALFISKHIFSAVLGAALFFFAPGGPTKLAGLFFFLMPLTACFTARDVPQKKELSLGDRRRLTAYAADIWKFFEDNVNASSHDLPPDNIQFSPYEKTACRTSPTNIGLYLAGILAARDLGLLDSRALFERVSRTLFTVERLKKWNGHLYNWYDTASLAVLAPSYVSSVDSGNFVACLYTLKNGLPDYTGEEPRLLELVPRIAALIAQTDFSVLYHAPRELFSVGAVILPDGSAKLDEGCYDYLMSEARILSYLAVSSRKVPKSHWKRLSRPLITSGGYIGLSSWSGTAFEYFMPNLFMPVRKGSLQYEAMQFAFRAQTARRACGIWGISESGFFAFDCDLNYQYKAFGVPLLGQKSGLRDDLVISPYSSFLAMCVSVPAALRNLEALVRIGAYGKYGCYEAVDFTRRRVKSGGACVKSYMSHHLGMSLLALDNAASDGAISKRFLSDRALACGAELLEEKIPVNAVIKKLRKTSVPQILPEKKRPPETLSFQGYSYNAPICACISDGKLSCVVSDCGHMRIGKGNVFFHTVSEKLYPFEAPASLFCYLKLDGSVYGLSPLSALPAPDASYAFSYSECTATQTLSCEKGTFSLSYTISPEIRSLVRIRLSGKASAQNAQFRFAFFPMLSSVEGHRAHPAFSELFLESEYDAEERILLFKRRPRSASEEELVLAVALSRKNAEVSFAARADGITPRSLIYDPFVLFDPASAESGVGACINPFCSFGAAYDGEAELLLVLTRRPDAAKEAIRAARDEAFDKASHALAEIASQFALGAGISSVSSGGTVRTMLSALLFGDGEANRRRAAADRLLEPAFRNVSIDALWKYGISGDLPIAVVDTGSYYFPAPPERCIRAYKLLTMKNVRFDLILFYRETDKYDRKQEKRLRELLESCGAQSYLGRAHGGIHLIETGALGADDAVFRFFAAFYAEPYAEMPQPKSGSKVSNVKLPVLTGKPVLPPAGAETARLSVRGGSFLPDGSFLVDKTSFAGCPPWSHILSGENISSVVTTGSLGYTFYKNAAERRITPWVESGGSELAGERLYLSENGVLFDLAACASQVRFSCGKAEYFGAAASARYHLSVFCAAKLPVKIIHVSFRCISPESKLFFAVEPCMGAGGRPCVIKAVSDRAVVFRNPLSDAFGRYCGFVSVLSEAGSPCFSRCDKAELFAENAAGSAAPAARNRDFACVGTAFEQDIDGKAGVDVLFLLGALKDGARFRDGLFPGLSGGAEKIGKGIAEPALEAAKRFSESLMPRLSFRPQDDMDPRAASLSVMFNRFLPYDAVFSRMLARSGFYQSGGAYGFRDQLQDCLTLYYSDPNRALAHLYRAAAHQFFEGDVLHWWHPAGIKGVRTRCSDDLIWLPYVMSELYALRGDAAFVEKEVPYLCGALLPDGVSEKYISCTVSPLRESLYLHGVRALDRACSLTGAHGLCLFGSCDWCDGYSLVGAGGSGESVFTSMFLAAVLDRFSALCRAKQDTERLLRYVTASEALKKAIFESGYRSVVDGAGDEGGDEIGNEAGDEKGGRSHGYFLRGYYDDGTPLGAPESESGKIDLLPQSFAPLCGMPDDAAKEALFAAYDRLFDRKYRILKLLAPPFDRGGKEPGYIKGYLPGVRENGGQYTHGALFFALGCFVCAKKLYRSDADAAKRLTEMGGEVLMASNPAYRASDAAPDAVRKSFLTEPYAAAADIYANPDHMGRGGWTHYTGAAGWLYRLILAHLLGAAFYDTATDAPYLLVDTERYFPFPELLDGASLEVRAFGFDTTVRYVVDGKPGVFADGVYAADGRIFRNVRQAEVHL